jgi:hypothetical protein
MAMSKPQEPALSDGNPIKLSLQDAIGPSVGVDLDVTRTSMRLNQMHCPFKGALFYELSVNEINQLRAFPHGQKGGRCEVAKLDVLISRLA